MTEAPAADAGQGWISRSELDNQINRTSHGVVYLIVKLTAAYQALASINCWCFSHLNLVAHINKVNRVSSITEFKVSAGHVGHRCYRSNQAPINQMLSLADCDLLDHGRELALSFTGKCGISNQLSKQSTYLQSLKATYVLQAAQQPDGSATRRDGHAAPAVALHASRSSQACGWQLLYPFSPSNVRCRKRSSSCRMARQWVCSSPGRASPCCRNRTG